MGVTATIIASQCDILASLLLDFSHNNASEREIRAFLPQTAAEKRINATKEQISIDMQMVVWYIIDIIGDTPDIARGAATFQH